MTLLELSNLIGSQVVIKSRMDWASANGGRWYCDLERVDVVEGNFLCGKTGNGATPEDALRDYVSIIRGQTIQHRDYDGNEREYDVPNTITVTNAEDA